MLKIWHLPREALNFGQKELSTMKSIQHLVNFNKYFLLNTLKIIN
jgi:hypothetical protein